MKTSHIVLLSILGIILIISLIVIFHHKNNQQLEVSHLSSTSMHDLNNHEVKVEEPTYSKGDLKASLKDENSNQEIITLELKSHNGVNEVKRVPTGQQVVMWYEFNSVNGISQGLGEPEFIDVKSGKDVKRDWQYVYWGEKDVNVPDYKETHLQNGTVLKEFKGMKKVKQDGWIEYNSKDVPKGNIVLGIEVEVLMNDYLDGVWEVGGQKISKHAQWVSINQRANLEDTWTQEELPNANHGGDPNLYNLGFVGGRRNIVQKFNISDINGTIVDANLSMYMNSFLQTQNLFVFYASNQTWDENDITYNTENTLGITGVGGQARSVDTTGWWVWNITNILQYAVNQGDDYLTIYMNTSGGLSGNYDTWDSRDAGLGRTPYINVSFLSIEDIDVQLISPSNPSTLLGNSSNFTASINNFNNLTINNATLNIWFANNTLAYTETNNSVNFTGLFNVNYYEINLTFGTYHWNVDVNYDNGTNNLTEFAFSNYTFQIGAVQFNSIDFNSSSIETKSETFTVNITTNGSSPANGVLIYQGVPYGGATIINTAGNDYNISRTIDVPIGEGNNTFFFNFTVGGTMLSTPSFQQNVSALNLTIITSGSCAVDSAPYLNISFVNENNLTVINAEIPASTFSYYIGGGTVVKNVSYTNNTNNYNYVFCFTSPILPINILPNLQYRNVPDYPQRIWNPQVQTYTNSTTNQTLYLLASTDGILVNFNIRNMAGQLLSGVDVVVQREINGVQTVISTATSSDIGIVTFFLNPDFRHYITFDKEGYTQAVFNDFPTLNQYTVVMGSSNSNQTPSYLDGVNWVILPSDTFFFENTSQTFNLSLDSSIWDLQSFGFNLSWGNGTSIANISGTNIRGGFLDFPNFNVGSAPNQLTLSAYYVINGTTNLIAPRIYIIQPYNPYSIWNFFQEGNTYISQGLFGFDDFGRKLISLIIVIVVVGGLSLRYGIQSETTLSGVLFGVVFFLEMGIRFIPQITLGSGAVVPRGIFTAITFLILFALAIREERQ